MLLGQLPDAGATLDAHDVRHPRHIVGKLTGDLAGLAAALPATLPCQRRPRPGGDDPPTDRLQRHRRPAPAEEPTVLRLERLPQRGQVDS